MTEVKDLTVAEQTGLKEIANYSRLQLAELILTRTIPYQIGQLDYKVTEDTLIVWSRNSISGELMSTSVIAHFSLFSSYVRYNEEEKRVELMIY